MLLKDFPGIYYVKKDITQMDFDNNICNIFIPEIVFITEYMIKVLESIVYIKDV